MTRFASPEQTFLGKLHSCFLPMRLYKSPCAVKQSAKGCVGAEKASQSLVNS